MRRGFMPIRGSASVCWLATCRTSGESKLAQNSKTRQREHARSARSRWAIDRLCIWYVRLVSARSSFFRLIRSLRPSASRLAAVILVCICSEVMSFDILKASPRGLVLLLAHSQLLRRIEVVVVESGGMGKIDQWSDCCSPESSDRKNKTDESRRN